MVRDFGGVVVDEVPDPMVRDATEFRPVAQGANRGFFALRKNAAKTEADDVGKLVLAEGGK